MALGVLVTGASGLLGTWLVRTAHPDIEITAVVHRTPVEGLATAHLDLRRAAAVRDVIARVHPAVVVHAAYDKDRASIVAATEHLVDAAALVDARLVHVSSDTVFGGDGTCRDETSPTDPTSDYGRWKAEAESAVLDADGAVVRTSLLVSCDPDDHGLRRIRAGAAGCEGGQPSGWYRDEYRQPAWASEVAAAIWRLVTLEPEARRGVWHLPGPERLSRYELARRQLGHAGLPASSITPVDRPVSSDRPADIVLGDDRARGEIGWAPAPI